MLISNGTSGYLSKNGVISRAKSSTTGPRMPVLVKIKSPCAVSFFAFGKSIRIVALAMVSARQFITQFSLVCKGIMAGCRDVIVCPNCFASAYPSPSAPSVGYPKPPVAMMI